MNVEVRGRFVIIWITGGLNLAACERKLNRRRLKVKRGALSNLFARLFGTRPAEMTFPALSAPRIVPPFHPQTETREPLLASSRI